MFTQHSTSKNRNWMNKLDSPLPYTEAFNVLAHIVTWQRSHQNHDLSSRVGRHLIEKLKFEKTSFTANSDTKESYCVIWNGYGVQIIFDFSVFSSDLKVSKWIAWNLNTLSFMQFYVFQRTGKQTWQQNHYFPRRNFPKQLLFKCRLLSFFHCCTMHIQHLRTLKMFSAKFKTLYSKFCNF